MQPTRVVRRRLTLLAAGLSLVVLSACHSSKRRANCCEGADCCQPVAAHEQRGPRDGQQIVIERRTPPREGQGQRGDNRDQNRGPVVLLRREAQQYDRRADPRQHSGDHGDHGGHDEQQAMQKHEQEDRIHRELHERLDRLTERVTELARRLDELTGERRRAERSIR